MEQFSQPYVDTEVSKWTGILARMENKTATFEDVACVAEFVIDIFSNVAGEYNSRNAGMIANGIEAWLNIKKAVQTQPATDDITR